MDLYMDSTIIDNENTGWWVGKKKRRIGQFRTSRAIAGK
jgi:hypothetical protein